MPRDIHAQSENGPSVVWVEHALTTCIAFPATVRSRMGCELVAVKRSGLGPAWHPMRAAPGGLVLEIHRFSGPSRPWVYQLFATTALPGTLVIVHASDRVWFRGKATLRKEDAAFVRARSADIAVDQAEHRADGEARARLVPVPDNPFVQLEFAARDAGELLDRARLIADLRRVLKRRGDAMDEDRVTRAIRDGDVDAVSADVLQRVADRFAAAQWPTP